jgi:hypothetical protein
MCKKEATFTQTRFAVSEDIDWLKSLPERFNLHPKQEWSEEDAKFIKELCNLLASIAKNNYVGRYYAPDLVSKLHSLSPKPKPEWNEEDERLLNIIIDILDREEHNGHLSHDDLKNCVKLIKSFRPQPHWKPSEEQMDALLWCVEHLGIADNHVLESLYNDLKKLI